MQHFAEKEVGDVDASKGEMDGVPFYIHAMKEPDYTMMLMSTYDTLTQMGETKKCHYTKDHVKKVKEFKYPEVIYNHYSYCNMIDNHNSYWMHPISMEETWMTMHWPNHVFCFVLVVAVVNIQNAACYFLNKGKLDALNMWHQIAKALIFNRHLDEQNDSQRLRKRGSTDMLSSWYRSSKNLFKGDWSLAKPNMASGNAQTVPNLCATTAHVHQD